MKKRFVLFSLLLALGCAPLTPLNNPAIGQNVTTPILSVTPKTGDFGGVQLGLTYPVYFTVKNTGVSVLKIKKVGITGSAFTLTDTNSYPYEVIADSGTAIPIGNSGKTLKFSADFKPVGLGIQTGKIVITYGLYSDETYEIPLTGEGLSCSAASVAVKGENWSPRQNAWFRYTADKFSIVEVNSCHQQPVAGPRELYLYLYSDCQGTLLAGGSEFMDSCEFGSAVFMRTVLNAGETIYLFWPQGFPSSAHVSDGFYFNILLTYPVDGDVCENAIPLALPVVNLFGNTRGLQDDYNYSPCSPFSNFMDGNDIVYTITLAEDGYLTGNILGAYASVHVLEECPKVELPKDHCRAYAGGPNGGQFRRKIPAGSYYVIISNWAPPQTVDYLLNLSWEGVSAVENDNLRSSLSVYPNPTADQFTVSVTNAEPADLTLELVSISGQKVYSKEVRAVYSYNDEIDVSRLARGVYYLKVNSGKDQNITKVVISDFHP